MKKIKLVCAICCMVIFCSIGMATVSSLNADEATYTISQIEIKDQYYKGEDLNVTNVKISDGTQSFDCDKFMLYPDGTTIRGDVFPLDREGAYMLKLQALINGKNIVIKKRIEVKLPICSISGSASMGEITPDGYYLNMVDGDTAIFNQIIDLRDVSLEDEIFKASIIPSVMGEADFNVLNLVMTDIADPDSTLRIRLRGYSWGTYALAGSTYQPLTGYEPEWDRVHKDNEWGAFSNKINFNGIVGGESIFDIRFDSKTREVYFAKDAFITDLDDPRQFANVWSGFTSGKVRISLFAAEYNKANAKILVKSIGGTKPNSEIYLDKDAPVINIEIEEIPSAKVGLPYNIFKATAIDNVDEVAVDVKVWKNYYKINSYNVNITNGTFTPLEIGEYEIVYTAIDQSNNKTVKVVKVAASKDISAPTIELKNALPTSGNIGSVVLLSDFSISGGSGAIIAAIEVLFNNKAIAVNNLSFLPEYEGKYSITYTATDYLGQMDTKTFNYDCLKADNAVFANVPVLPRYMIKGKTYDIPSASVVDYSSGSPLVQSCEIYTVINSTNKKLTSNTFTADTAQREVEFIYKYKDILSKSIIVQVRDVGSQGSLDLSQYFDTNSDVDKTSVDNGILFNTTTNSSFTFIREILAEEMSLKFQVDSSKANYDGLSITLTDSLNAALSVKVTFNKNGAGVSILLNDTFISRLLGFGFNEESATNEFSLTMTNRFVSPFAGVNIQISNFENGEVFNGFPSKKVYATFAWENVNGESSLNIRNINGQTFNSSTSDKMKPQIILYGDYGGESKFGSEVSTPQSDALDVLDPNIQYTVSVISPDKSFAISTTGKELREVSPKDIYTFTISQYGQYVIRFIAKDSDSGQTAQRSYIVICENRTIPGISFAEAKGSCAVGENVAIPTLIIEGENDIKLYTKHMFVTTPSGQNLILLEDYNGFIASAKGTYRVVCVISDELGNQSMAIYEVKAV